MSTILLNNAAIDASAAPPHQSLLDFVRNTARLTGTKEGCASGDCGACTLILRNPDGTQPINVNSCITPVGAAINKQVITVEGVGTPEHLHPVQQAMVDQHGSQCGFCTPGFVMSLVAAQLKDGEAPKDRDAAITSVSGNLCRCTGYRPIIDAAVSANATSPLIASTKSSSSSKSTTSLKMAAAKSTTYARPTTLADVLALMKIEGAQRSLHSEGATANWLLAGATDAFLEVTQHYLDPNAIIDLSDVEELKGISRDNDGALSIGAATTHADALAYFSQPNSACAAIGDVLARFGSPQIRNRGTLGGNIANASPIADWPPLLIAMRASVELVDADGEQRSVALDEFYLGYKSTQLKPNELIRRVHIPSGVDFSALRAHKISKRFEDDISSALGAVYVQLQNGVVDKCRIAYGGVGPVPLRCRSAENALLGKKLSEQLIDIAVAALAGDIAPISDVRASENYRREASKAVLREALKDFLDAHPSAHS